jgi:glucose/mannose-6-phosphate isomerase
VSIVVEPVDSLGIWEATFDIAEQIERARSAFGGSDATLPPSDGLTHAVVFGMGGSGISGDIAAFMADLAGTVPVLVSKGYECPAWVGPNTLAFGVSFSGNTEEVVEVTTDAQQRGAQVVAVAGGGMLAELAADWGAPLLGVETELPMPRVATGALSVPVLLALDRMGLVSGVDHELDATVAQLRRRAASLRGGPGLGEVEGLTELLAGRIPLVYGAGRLGQIAAGRWKTQVNENADAPAFANTLPEACHNELQGWDQNGDLTRAALAVVELRHGHEHRQHAPRFDFVGGVVDPSVAGRASVRAAGDTALAQLFDLMLYGDVVSLHLAAASGVDPGPIPVLERLKQFLA